MWGARCQIRTGFDQSWGGFDQIRDGVDQLKGGAVRSGDMYRCAHMHLYMNTHTHAYDYNFRLAVVPSPPRCAERSIRPRPGGSSWRAGVGARARALASCCVSPPASCATP